MPTSVHSSSARPDRADQAAADVIRKFHQAMHDLGPAAPDRTEELQQEILKVTVRAERP